jgi:small subunit ribosomal protein S6
LSTVVKRLYEGLFLVDSGEAATDWKGINNTIEKTLARADAEIVSMKKWDERRLAYDINGKSRGTYILTYFQGDPAKIGAIERTVQLSEQIMRVLIIRTDKMSAEDMEKASPLPMTETAHVATEVEKPARVDTETETVRASAPKAKRSGRAAASKQAETKQAEPTKVEAVQDSSGKPSSSGSQDQQKTSKEPQEEASSESEAAEK